MVVGETLQQSLDKRNACDSMRAERLVRGTGT